jgi:opacity protein-like surface antigen
MKKITVLVAMALAASTSFAQMTSETKGSSAWGTGRTGVRVSLLKPILDGTATVAGTSGTNKLDDSFGLAVGWANMPVQTIGWTSNLAYMTSKTVGTTIDMLRLDGNAAWAFTEMFNVKGGINVSKITTGPNASSYNPGIGFQAGVGAQVWENIGVDLAYTQMNQKGSASGVDIEFKEQGAEIGVNATF